MIEIENDPDNSRRRKIMESSYLKQYNLDVNDMESLNTYINSLTNEIVSLERSKKSLQDNNYSSLNELTAIKLIQI